MNAAEPIDGSTATPAELWRAGIDALVKALGPVGMVRFLQQFDPGHGNGRSHPVTLARAKRPRKKN